MIDANIFRNLFRRAVLLPVVLVGLATLVLVLQIASMISASHQIDTADQVIASAHRCQELALDVEVGVRGYLISKQTEFMDPFFRGTKQINGAFRELISLTASDRTQQMEAKQALEDFNLFDETQKHEIVLRGMGFDYVSDFNRGESKVRMDRLRTDINEIVVSESGIRSRREQSAREDADYSLALTGICALAVAGLLSLFSRNQLQSLSNTYEDALEAAHSARELLSTTLMSIGDAVLVTDVSGRVTILNAVAEQLTGWSSDDARGQDSRSVFKIISEETRKEVASPVARVLSNGVRTGLAYRTLLVRRDGAEIPIDDSGAPIFDSEGRLIGAVLVFRDVSARRNEEARLRETLRREHNIADRLQASLQPSVPANVKGLDLAEYYKPALDEARVGGDFCDVFAGPGDQTYLIVGDLSGKGLAAAEQVSTVRNMLRFALYNGRSIAGPITRLNKTIIENRLLSGFATLLVASYDPGSRTLTYVNCGQEPSLLSRSDRGGLVELGPTGPVLGSLLDAEYLEEELTLAKSDTLAIFTDGLPEAGPSRQEMLGITGVGSILNETTDGCSAEQAVESIIAGMNSWSNGLNHDDVCLLIAVVKD